MARWQQDVVDFACEAWAFQWINLFARLPLKGSEQLGRTGSTLDLIKVMGDGAGAGGIVTQFYPECFMGDGLVVACALRHLREKDRDILWHHYVDRWYYAHIVAVKTADGREIYQHTTTAPFVHPTTRAVSIVRVVDRTRPDTQVAIERRPRPVKQQTMAHRMGISRAEYHSRRDRMKAFMLGLIVGQKCLDTKVGHETGVPA